MNELVIASVLSALLAVVLMAQVRERNQARAERAAERAQWNDERSRLLDRIMARNYNEFVYSSTVTTSETPQMTTDEAEAAWAVAHRQDADAAWHAENKKEHPELYPDDGDTE